VTEAAMIQPATSWAPDLRGLLLAETSFEDIVLSKIFQMGITVG